MGKTKDTGHLAHIVGYDGSNNITIPAGLKINGADDVMTSAAMTSTLGGYVPASRVITINGTALDLSANRSFTIAAGLTSFNTRTGAITLSSEDVTTALGFTPYNATNPAGYITGISFANVSAKPTTLSGYGITDAVPSARTITINGTTFDLSANRSWTIAGGGTDATKLPLSGGTLTGNLKINPVSEAWAEGLSFSVPSTNTWAGIRWRRERASYEGNWALGYTGADNTDDLTFWANNGGSEGMKARIDKSGNFTAFGSLRSPVFKLTNSTNNSYITGDNLWGAKFVTDNGYIWIGPANNGTAHIYTDRPSFYFNAPLLVNGTSVVTNSGTWSISISGNSSTVGGYSVAVGGSANTIPTRNGSGYLIPENWIQLNGSYGLYSPTNSAHLFPNNLSYGSWKVLGERNGWRGIHFGEGTGMTLMMNEGECGFHREGYGWTARFTSGTGHFGVTGNAGNTSSISNALGNGHDWTGTNQFLRNNGGQAVNNSNTAALQAFSTGNNSAFMSFHRGGYYAVNFGLDNDDWMRIGGWSAGANRWQLNCVSGDMVVNGDVTAFSDARVKENVVTVDKALEKVLALRGVYYNRIDSEDKKRKLGVIAQETLTVVPEVVNTDAFGTYNVSYGNLGGLFIEAIKDQQQTINTLTNQLNHLKAIIDGITR